MRDEALRDRHVTPPMTGLSADALRRAVIPVWAAVLTGTLLWPQRRAGYGMGHDMVFTPRYPLTTTTLGVSSTPPRAVPVDVLVALLDRIAGGVVIGRLALVVPLLLAGVGAARLLAGASTPARLAACGFAIWNPFVVERLGLGQWALLWGYAALPWLIAGTLAIRRGHRAVWCLIPALAAASITPTGGVLAVAVVVSVAAWPGQARTAVALRTVAVAIAFQLPWLVASVLSTASSFSDPSSADAFRSRAEFGDVALTLLGLGGTWDAQIVPASRGGLLAGVSLVVSVGAAVVARRHLRHWLGPAAGGLTACAALGFVVAVAGALPGLDAVFRRAVSDLPGGGLLRDAQKWLAPLALLEAVVLGIAIQVVVDRLPRTRPVWTSMAVIALALPLAVLPDATRTVWPTVTPVRYPAGYAHVARLVRGHGDVAVVPFQPYRRFAWAGDRVAFDPSSLLLPGTVVVDDRLQVGSRLLAGEDPRAARVAAALTAGRALTAKLRDAGVTWVLLERRTPGTVPPLASLQLVYSDRDVRLYRVSGSVEHVRAARWRVVVAATVLGGWIVALLAAALTVAFAELRRSLARRALQAKT